MGEQSPLELMNYIKMNYHLKRIYQHANYQYNTAKENIREIVASGLPNISFEFREHRYHIVWHGLDKIEYKIGEIWVNENTIAIVDHTVPFCHHRPKSYVYQVSKKLIQHVQGTILQMIRRKNREIYIRTINEYKKVKIQLKACKIGVEKNG